MISNLGNTLIGNRDITKTSVLHFPDFSFTRHRKLLHPSIYISSDTDFTVTFGETVKEYAAGDKVAFRNGSEELQNDNAKIASKVEGGKIKVK